MKFKSVASFLVTEGETDLVLTAAADIARVQDAHLAVCTLGVDAIPAGGFYMGASAVILSDALGRAQAAAQALEGRVTRRLTSEALRWSVEAAIAPFGGLSQAVGARARYADLVVQARPYGPAAQPAQVVVLEAALFQGGAPVLVVPDTGLGGSFGQRIVLAWNESPEALVAARRALPLLVAAQSVTVLVVDPPSHGPERSDPGGALTQWLVRHGVRAEVAVLARTLPRASDVILRHMADQGAGLLVMGAYGHSRLREAILGGATRHVLEATRWPVFLAH